MLIASTWQRSFRLYLFTVLKTIVFYFLKFVCPFNIFESVYLWNTFLFSKVFPDNLNRTLEEEKKMRK